MKKPITPDLSLGEEPAPLVDDALAATDRRIEEHEELRALRSEVARLQESLRETARGAGRVAVDELRTRIREQPVTAAVVVGFLAFLYGTSR
jgi:urease accessory protein UreF